MSDDIDGELRLDEAIDALQISTETKNWLLAKLRDQYVTREFCGAEAVRQFEAGKCEGNKNSALLLDSLSSLAEAQISLTHVLDKLRWILVNDREQLR